MARSLVIVESPAKAKTINKYLGRNYTVKASIGHVMDLPKKTIGIRLPGEEETNGKKKRRVKKGKKTKEKPARAPISLDDEKIFEPTLQIIAGKGKIINDLRRAANSADAVYLAGDPDREGEAISAHLAMVLAKPSKFPEQEPSAPRFKKKNAKAEEPEEPVKQEPKKRFRRRTPKRFSASPSTKLRPRRFARPLNTREKWTRTSSTLSRRAAFSTASSATRFRRSSGTKSAEAFPPGEFRRWRSV